MQRFIEDSNVSPELAYAACPDCDNIMVVRFMVITTNGKLLGLSSCGFCADRVTVRVNYPVTRDEWRHMAKSGVPLMEVKRG